MRAMAKFEKLSFWYMCAMTFITLSLYPWAWVVDTTRQLRRAGGKVPDLKFYFAPILMSVALLSIILMAHILESLSWLHWDKFVGLFSPDGVVPLFFSIIAMLLSLYFWFGYVLSYCDIVLQKNDSKTFWTYFVLTAVFENRLMFIKLFDPIKPFIISNFPLITDPFMIGLASYIIYILFLNIGRFLLFQWGYNKYVDQNNLR